MKLTPGANAPPEFAIRCAAYILGSRIMSVILVLYCFAQSLGILLGDPLRFSGIAYSIAVQIPGAPEIWGFVLLSAALSMTLGRLLDQIVWVTFGMGLAGVWSMCFALSFGIAAYNSPEANITAVMVYGKDALIFITFAAVFHSSHYRRKGSDEVQEYRE